MKQAADAGLSPLGRYTSLEDQIAITDFVKAVPFSAPEALKRMPGVLRAVHACRRFRQPQITSTPHALSC